uniref:Ras-GEF domain-containing protein n=1 Tax=Angiostrongylus cantonensis TaxID=6313 RepID=A0A0K0D244_ANGCA
MFLLQALMLDEAIAFERLVIPKKNEPSTISHVTWEDPKQLEDFISKLQLASDKLSNHNRSFLPYHLVCVLLARACEKNVFSGTKKIDTIAFFCLLLLSKTHSIKDKRQKKLQLRPPIEEIRAKYYKEMRKLLSIPLKFKGVLDGEQSTFFSTMLADNADRFPRVYVKAEQLMRAVEQVDAQFADWLVPAQVDLELLIEETLKTASDWEAQLKFVKAKGREAAKLPNEIRLDCIVVSTTGAKTAIDELLQHVFDTLVYTLRLSINTKLQNIQQFLTQAIDVLSSRPQSIDEVAEANARHVEYGLTNRKVL